MDQFLGTWNIAVISCHAWHFRSPFIYSIIDLQYCGWIIIQQLEGVTSAKKLIVACLALDNWFYLFIYLINIFHINNLQYFVILFDPTLSCVLFLPAQSQWYLLNRHSISSEDWMFVHVTVHCPIYMKKFSCHEGLV